MDTQLELLQLLNTILLVISSAIIAACFTVFFHTVIGSPQINIISRINENSEEERNAHVEIDDTMILSFLGNYIASAYVWFENKETDFTNPFKVFICQFCFNFWSSLTLSIIVIANTSLNWYYFLAIVVFSSFIRTKYIA